MAQTIKVYALGSDGTNGTECSIFTSEIDLYTALADMICSKDEHVTAMAFVASSDIDGLKDYLTDEVSAPEFFTYCIDEKEINLHGPAIVDVCIAGNPAQNGICGDPDCVCAPKPERRTINLTPRGLETQEGIARCNAATEAFTALTATVANLATEMVETHARNEQWDSESHDELKAAIASRRAAQEEFLRSLCGAPPAA